MSRTRRLFTNTIVIFIGNFASKLLTFLLLPLLTRYLSKYEYGLYDLITTGALIVIPIITFQMSDSVFRFLLDTKNEQEIRSTVSNTLAFILVSCSFSAVFYLIIASFANIPYSFIIVLFILTQTVFVVWLQIARGFLMNIVFSISGVIGTVLTLALSFAAVKFFQNKLSAVIIVSSIAFIVSFLYMEYKIGAIRKFSIKSIDISLMKRMMAYSIPLIPNTLNWWILNVSNRYIISIFAGIEANSIYAVASRLAGLIAIINGIFIIAWQESAIKEFGSEGQDEFYSKVFNAYMRIQFSAVILFLPAIYFCMDIIVGYQFTKAVIYIPILLIGGLFSAFASFYGVGYLSTKRTFGASTTTVFAAIANILLNIILFPFIGLFSAPIAQLISSFVLWRIRVMHLKKYFNVRLEFRSFTMLLFCTICSTVIFYLRSGVLIAGGLILSVIVSYIYNIDIIRKVLSMTKLFIFKQNISKELM